MNLPIDTAVHAAEWEAAKTVMRLFQSLDDGDYDGVAAQFAQDGVWVRMGESLNGPAAVRSAMATRPATLKTHHMITNMLAQAQPDGSVEARYTITVFDAFYAGSGPAPLTMPGAIFSCHDRLTCTEAGWRFASRHPVPMFKRP